MGKMKLDHVVYFSKKTPGEIVQEKKALGYHVVIGGQHKQWGTENALLYVKNAYVEWLTTRDLEIMQQATNPLIKLYRLDLEEGEGWGTICLSVNQIDQYNEQLQKKGYKTSGVINAERKTTSGQIRKWKMLFIEEEPSVQLPFPFFIEWEQDDEERLAVLRQDGTILPANEQLTLTKCLFQVKDPEQVVARWADLFELVTIDHHTIELENSRLSFIACEENEKERLIDITIEYKP